MSSGFKLPSIMKEEEKIQRKSEEILEYINLGQRKDELASNLPIGEQRVLEIGRALATEPRLILLDENPPLEYKGNTRSGEIIEE